MKRSDYLKNIEDNNVSYWLYVRENLKPNDYAKLNTGEITRSINVSHIRGNKIYYANGDDCWFDISAVRNFSPYIIDLIEVGDYVNGGKVIDIAQAPEKALYTEDISQKGALIPITNNRIKSVLTKEQFESMEYKL